MTTPTLLAAAVALLAVGCLALLLVVRTRRDAVTLVTVHLALLFVIPAFMVFGPMGAIGSPALLAGLSAAAVWVVAKVVPSSGIDRGWQPLRLALVVYAAVMLASYANGQLRPLTELEQSGSTRAVIFLVSLLGIALLIADGVPTRQRLDTLLRRLVLAAGFVGFIGIIQFFTGLDPTPHFLPPGLELNRDLVGISGRSLFNRPWGTMQHPIEFGVVLGALVPLALHYAVIAPRGWARVRQWGLVVIIAAAVPMSVSRSGVVSLLVALTVLSLAWSWRDRFNLAGWLLGFTAVMWAVVPGLIGTLRSLFAGHETDPSIMARRERVPILMDYIAEHPWLGHGFGTFSVEEYLLVDNELYVTAISTGLIGLATFLALIVTGGLTAIHVRRFTDDLATRQLAQSIAAGLAALMVCLYTFDAFHYRIFMGTMFILLGSAGALYRITRADAALVDGEDATTPGALPSPAPRAG